MPSMISTAWLGQNPTTTRRIIEAGPPTYYATPALPFTVQPRSSSTVYVNGGTIAYAMNDFRFVVGGVILTVANNDWIWLQQDGDYSWSIQHGASSSMPTATHVIVLCIITIASGNITVNLSGGWHGGDILYPFSTKTFYVYPVSATQVNVSYGTIIHPYNGVQVTVAAKTITISGTTWIWVERTGNNDWAINSGYAFPSDKICIPLAEVWLSSGFPNVYYLHDGGDLLVPETFPVSVSGLDGATPTYTAETLNGISITIGRISNYRDPHLIYKAGSRGLANIETDGSFSLFVVDEAPKTKTQKVITSITFDGTTLKDTYQTLTVFDTSTTDTSETIDTPVACT